MSNIAEKVRSVITDKLGINPEEITDEKTFNDLGADSLDGAELIMEFEKEFNINIADPEAEAITTIRSVIELIKKKIDEKDN